MIGKVSKQLSATRLTKSKKVKKRETSAHSADGDSLVEKVLQALTIDTLDSNDKIRNQIILKTLTQALGERASNEVAFKRILGKIDNTLKNDANTERVLNEIKKTYLSKK